MRIKGAYSVRLVNQKSENKLQNRDGNQCRKLQKNLLTIKTQDS